jgi:hypothetical protein
MEKRYVECNGVRVIEGWPERLAEAQLERTYEIAGREYQRIPYGDEKDWSAAVQPCRDCAAIKGQLHVVGCDVERCPACGGQAISCDCADDVDDHADEG